MVSVKMMNQKTFDKMSNDFVAFSELIKTRQDEKKSIFDEFSLELKRFKAGQISEDALENSIKKKEKEVEKIDKNIESAMKKGNDLAKRMVSFFKDQKPEKYKISKSGVSGGGTKKKVSKKKTKKKPIEKKKSKKNSKAKKRVDSKVKQKKSEKKEKEAKKEEEKKKTDSKKKASKKKKSSKK